LYNDYYDLIEFFRDLGLSVRKIFFGLLVFFIVNTALCESAGKATLCSYDYYFLEELYKYDSNGSLSQKLDNLEIDYYLSILSQHILILEYEIAEKKSWFGRSDVRSFFAELRKHEPMGWFFLIFSAVGVVGAGGFYSATYALPVYDGYTQLKSSQFTRVKIPNFMLRMLRSIRFTRLEKQRLDKRAVGQISYASAWQLNRKPYTKKEIEKIEYLARKLAPIQTIAIMIPSAMTSLYCMVSTGLIIGCIFLFPRRRMMQSLAQCLERDKRLYELLNNAKKL